LQKAGAAIDRIQSLTKPARCGSLENAGPDNGGPNCVAVLLDKL